LFQDEARFGRISGTRRCWCPRPHRPVVATEVSQEYTYAYATVSVPEGALDSLILPHVNGTCMQIFLDEVAARYPEDRLVMVMDGAGWHRNQDLVIPENMRLLTLPPYSPELNPVEHLWDELREKWFHNRVFDSLEALEDHLETGLRSMEGSPEIVRSIVSWPWIIDSLLI
jgi:transposase